LPVMWLDETGSATPSLIKQFKGKIGLAIEVSSDAHTVGLVVGSLLLAISVALVLVLWKQIIDEQKAKEENMDLDVEENTPLINDRD
jgi:hypothetical protein